jgi:hypothetical protein
MNAYVLCMTEDKTRPVDFCKNPSLIDGRRVRLDGGEEMNLLPQNVESVGEARLRALELKPGRPVIIAGLKKSVEFNGMHAVIVRSANEGKKYVVSFDQVCILDLCTYFYDRY